MNWEAGLSLACRDAGQMVPHLPWLFSRLPEVHMATRSEFGRDCIRGASPSEQDGVEVDTRPTVLFLGGNGHDPVRLEPCSRKTASRGRDNSR